MGDLSAEILFETEHLPEEECPPFYPRDLLKFAPEINESEWFLVSHCVNEVQLVLFKHRNADAP